MRTAAVDQSPHEPRNLLKMLHYQLLSTRAMVSAIVSGVGGGGGVVEVEVEA